MTTLTRAIGPIVHPSHSAGAGVFAQGQSILRQWWNRHQSRAQLLRLDDRLLKDIGVTRAEAHLEGRKSFWEV
ncbi:MAG: DUF1127 domain-containing protein [SAR324 cluster bacterium]|nr:DUF1127 domain-containing protein [SAR324 cluster bacterium]